MFASGGGDEAPSGGGVNTLSAFSPALMALTDVKFLVATERICSPEETSHSRKVPSFEAERIVRPRAMIAVDVTALV